MVRVDKMRKVVYLIAALIGFISIQPAVAQQVTVEDYARAEGFLRNYTAPLVFKDSVSPVWISDSEMWYRNNISAGSEFIYVDAAKGKRELAFNHDLRSRSEYRIGPCAWTMPAMWGLSRLS